MHSHRHHRRRTNRPLKSDFVNGLLARLRGFACGFDLDDANVGNVAENVCSEDQLEAAWIHRNGDSWQKPCRDVFVKD